MYLYQTLLKAFTGKGYSVYELVETEDYAVEIKCRVSQHCSLEREIEQGYLMVSNI